MEYLMLAEANRGVAKLQADARSRSITVKGSLWWRERSRSKIMNLNTPDTPPPATPGCPRRILVVDDERNVRAAVAQLLSCEGYEVLAAADGSEALNHAQHDNPDLMLLDLALPSDPFGGGNFDGFGVMQWLKRRVTEREIPIIILTGRHDAAARNRAAELGAVGYFTKPFVGTELLEAIRAVLSAN